MDGGTDHKREVARRLASSGPMDPEYEETAAELWGLLDAAERDTLHCLVKQGPVWDGDVPSKTGRSTLIGLGLASKAVVKGEHGYQVATYRGWDVWHQGAPGAHGPRGVARLAVVR